MNKTLVTIGAIIILALSGIVLVVIPHFSILRQIDHTNIPPVLSEQAQRGRAVYIDLGCVYCHSQQPRHKNFGPDYLRGWGHQPEAKDYFGQNPHQLGTMRTGPDLFNIGDRNPSLQWHLVHLYQPQLVVPWSIMPAFPFLFEEKTAPEEGDVILKLADMGIERENTVVASQRALDLVVYLRELKQKEKPDED
ncbi:MAG: cbb3-type cytochrome c oxidase subunit II [Pseudobacteriovorax sp.]|nr:cbb3-type cytochrome c oxidase subunit II [Pseudobacteriovorax sp.]